MGLRRRIGTAIGMIVAVSTLGVVMSMPASATTYYRQCAQAGTGYCLNNWGGGGNGNPVKMYTAGAVNDRFALIFDYACAGNDLISDRCIAQWGGDPNIIGALIVQIQDQNNGSLCVGTNGSGYAVLAPCGARDGTGAGNGTIMATIADPNCNGSAIRYLLDRYWSNINQADTWLLSGGAIGAQALFIDTDHSCWGTNVN